MFNSALTSDEPSHSIGEPTQHVPSPRACADSIRFCPARLQSPTGPDMMMTTGASQKILKPSFDPIIAAVLPRVGHGTHPVSGDAFDTLDDVEGPGHLAAKRGRRLRGIHDHALDQLARHGSRIIGSHGSASVHRGDDVHVRISLLPPLALSLLCREIYAGMIGDFGAACIRKRGQMARRNTMSLSRDVWRAFRTSATRTLPLATNYLSGTSAAICLARRALDGPKLADASPSQRSAHGDSSCHLAKLYARSRSPPLY